MSCDCHGESGVSVTRTSPPYDQCTMCAKKHIVKAWSLFNEFTYTDDNRDAMTGQLRLAVGSLPKPKDINTALRIYENIGKCRDDYSGDQERFEFRIGRGNTIQGEKVEIIR